MDYRESIQQLRGTVYYNRRLIRVNQDIEVLRHQMTGLAVERHIKYTKKIKLNARRHNVKFRSIQII